MMQYKRKVGLGVISVCAVAIFAAGCQKKSDEEQSHVGKNAVTLVQAKVVEVKHPSKTFCDEDECTEYSLKTVQTNLPWINEYFLKRIEKDVPDAFTLSKEKDPAKVANQPTGESQISVRYLGQNDQFASFEMQTSLYGAGAAHGMSHNEYVIFDLSQKKRLALADILKPNIEKKLLEKLYEANQTWLEAHKIEPAKLELSDNYYYGVNGIVFVYPLYELASYAEGMSELTLPYYDAAAFIKPEYLINQ